MDDLAIIGQDPAFGGGSRAQTEALWRAAEQLGRDPMLHYLRYPQLTDRNETCLRGTGAGPLVPGLDAANVLAAAVRTAPRARRARTRFVCAAVASHGYGAVLSGRPFGCWASTSLAEEWHARRGGLDRGRRASLAVGGPLLRALERATLRRARPLWTISAASRRALAAASGIGEEEIQVVPIPVDAARFAPLPENEWLDRLDDPELVFVGRADDPRKNVPLLVEAFERLRSQVPRARLTLIGDPPARPLPDGIEATGRVGSVADRLRQAALLVLPSRQEGFGIVVAEALAAGVPVIVTPCGGPEELVRASGGGEVLSGFGVRELADRAGSLLANRDRLLAMRRQGREHVLQAHDPAHLRDALAEAIDELDA